ncbi:hypothetical protein H9659_12840 [Sporosarcina sp. Sa3CUA8]|uniref:Uncharacterized protein n=1 Tax=Sporosarcina gallistercoris TaxID=2762245 RepID=A0ABR8PM16_9BACL|nr:hypothetical protein [Sporosarcina gallistercoris]
MNCVRLPINSLMWLILCTKRRILSEKCPIPAAICPIPTQIWPIPSSRLSVILNQAKRSQLIPQIR